jgi:hypothetical protein
VFGDLRCLDLAVGDVALDRLDKEHPGAAGAGHLGMKEAPALVAVDDVAGLDRSCAHGQMIAAGPDGNGALGMLASPIRLRSSGHARQVSVRGWERKSERAGVRD